LFCQALFSSAKKLVAATLIRVAPRRLQNVSIQPDLHTPERGRMFRPLALRGGSTHLDFGPAIC
jgi:hypothetical protein